MKNIETWIHNFKNLNSEQQLEVAKSISNELKQDEWGFLYDQKEESRRIREFFNRLLEFASNLTKTDGKESLLDRFEKLSPERKERALSKSIKLIEAEIESQIQENKENECKQCGHNFGKWNYRKYTKYIDTVIDHQYVSNFPIETEEWKRTCGRCGFIETAFNEPEEAREERLDKEKKERIRELKKELKRLENK